MKEDEAIESFFKEMKNADEYLSVPTFSEQSEPARRRQWPLFLYAAATLAAVIVALIFFYKDEDQIQNDQIVIVIEEDEVNTNSLLEEETFSEWHSPTSFLAEDF